MSTHNEPPRGLQSLEAIVRTLTMAQRKKLKAEIFDLTSQLGLDPLKHQYLVKRVSLWPPRSSAVRNFVVVFEDDHQPYHSATFDEMIELLKYTPASGRVMLSMYKGRLPHKGFRSTRLGPCYAQRTEDGTDALRPLSEFVAPKRRGY